MTPLLLAVSLLLAAPVPKDFKKDAPRPPDGAWRLTADQTDDIILVVEKMTWQFEGAGLTIRVPGQAPQARGPIYFDPATTPHTFDLCARLGVCQLKGDTLTVCLGPSNGARPANLEGGLGVRKLTFARVEPNK